MDPFLQTVLATLIGVVGTFIASSGWWGYRSKKLELEYQRKMTEAAGQTMEHRAIIALLHDRLYALCKAAIRHGSISTDDLDNIKYIWEPYTAMGGNGTGKRLWIEVNKLPISDCIGEASNND